MSDAANGGTPNDPRYEEIGQKFLDNSRFFRELDREKHQEIQREVRKGEYLLAQAGDKVAPDSNYYRALAEFVEDSGGEYDDEGFRAAVQRNMAIAAGRLVEQLFGDIRERDDRAIAAAQL
jgi:hypothetical protein